MMVFCQGFIELKRILVNDRFLSGIFRIKKGFSLMMDFCQGFIGFKGILLMMI